MWREGPSCGPGKGNLATAQQEAGFPTFTALLAKALPSPSLPSGNEGSEGNLIGEGGGDLAFDCQFRSSPAAALLLRGRRLHCLHRSSRTRSEGSHGGFSLGGLEQRRWSRRKILDSGSTSLAMNAREVPLLSSFDRAPNGTKALHSS